MNISGNKSIFTNSLSGLQKINKLLVNTLNGLSSFELNNLSGSTSNIQQQINNINSGNSEQVVINENAISALQNRASDDEQNITELQIKTQNMNVDDSITIFSGDITTSGINGISNTLLQFLLNCRENIQSQLDSLPTNNNFLSINSSISAIQNTISNMVYSNNQTTFNDNFYVNGNFTTSGTINGISNTLLQYLLNCRENIQSQLDGLPTSENFSYINSQISAINTTLTGMSFVESSSSTTAFSTNMTVVGTLNNVPNSIFQYLINCREDIQYALDHAYTTITINSVTGVAYGQSANITNTGTTKTALLNFYIPAGQPGESITGPAGIDAIQPTFTIGSVTDGSTPSVTLTGTQTEPILNFVLKQGNDGQNGRDGSDGSDGRDGSDGQDGADGDSSIATASAVAAAASAAVASAAAIGSAASASASAISAASALTAVAAIQTEVNTLNTQVQTIQTEVTTLNTDVDVLQLKTSAQSNNGVSTIFNNIVEGSSLVSNSTLYVPNNATVLGTLYTSNITSLTEISINAPTITLNGISINLNGFVNDGFNIQNGFFNQF